MTAAVERTIDDMAPLTLVEIEDRMSIQVQLRGRDERIVAYALVDAEDAALAERRCI